MPRTFDGDSHPDDIQLAIGQQMAAVDPNVSPFRLRNRFRNGGIVSIAVPQGYRYDEDALD